jgi:hypothetical protein
MDQHWMLGHRGDRRVGILPLELSGGVGVPHIDQSLLCGGEVRHSSSPSIRSSRKKLNFILSWR